MENLNAPRAVDVPRLRGLYVITDSQLTPSQHLIECVALALRGGAALVQYRDKSMDAARRAREARELAVLCRAHRVPLIINDDAALAASAGADGVHLGRDDGDIAQARRVLGENAIIGASCYNALESALRAQEQGADYVAFGAFFPSATKPRAVRADADILKQAKQKLRIPIAAIGGITPVRGADLIAAGADMLAVAHGVFGQSDIMAAARQYAQLFTR